MAISGDLNLFRSVVPHPSLTFLPYTTVPYGRFPSSQSETLKSKAHTHKSKPQCKWSKKDNNNVTAQSTKKGFPERLGLAWNTLFPPTKSTNSSNAGIAKQRLKMILYSDRCEVSDIAKRKIVSSIVKALSDFVEIESRDKVQLNVSADTGLGTVYSVVVPVRRVRPEYQESDEDFVGSISGIEYKDKGDESGSVDVKFNFFVPDDK